MTFKKRCAIFTLIMIKNQEENKMLPGRYIYSIKKTFGKKEGFIDVEINKNLIKGKMLIKNKETPVTGKVDGHRVEIYGSIVGKLRTYVFSIGAYMEGNKFKGKLEDKHGAKEIEAVLTNENIPVEAEEKTTAK